MANLGVKFNWKKQEKRKEIAHQGFWIFYWLKAITWLWGKLPHRLSKRQSPPAVPLRTPITHIVIIFNQGMLLLGSNKFLKRQRSRMMALFKSMACSIQETNYGEKNDKIYGKLQEWTLLYILQRKMIKSHSHQSFAVSRKLKCVM